jgi:hypothetical protein
VSILEFHKRTLCPWTLILGAMYVVDRFACGCRIVYSMLDSQRSYDFTIAVKSSPPLCGSGSREQEYCLGHSRHIHNFRGCGGCCGLFTYVLVKERSTMENLMSQIDHSQRRLVLPAQQARFVAGKRTRKWQPWRNACGTLLGQQY